MTEKEKTIINLKKALNSLDITSNLRLVLIETIEYLQEESVEAKEVDLDREIKRYRMRNPIIQHREESLYGYMANVAKHFFELGMAVSNKVQKGE